MFLIAQMLCRFVEYYFFCSLRLQGIQNLSYQNGIVGGKKAAKDEEDDFKVDDDFKDLGFDDGSVGGGGFDDDDDDF